MLRFYGGAATFIVCDNLKAAVIERPRRRDPVIQPTFQMFCEHYGMGALPTRARRPKDKALVENAVKLIQRLLRLALLDRPPMTLSELNALLRACVDGPWSARGILLDLTGGATAVMCPAFDAAR